MVYPKSNLMKKKYFLHIALLIGAFYSILVFNFSSTPYLLISICWLTIVVLGIRHSHYKAILFNIAYCLFLMFALELYSLVSLHSAKKEQDISRQGSYTYADNYFVDHALYGYSSPEKITVDSKLFYQEKLIYDVIYTIKNGRRIVPEIDSDKCIVFFGGSFTFGEGLSDERVSAYLVGLQIKTENFGFHGYGPHQMLSAISNAQIPCSPQLVIYQALPSHVERALGFVDWGSNAPWYEREGGKIIYKGKFSDRPMDTMALQKFHFYQKFIRYRIARDEIDLFIDIIQDSQARLKSEFPEVSFQVLLWDNPEFSHRVRYIKQGLKDRKINYQLVSNILPGYTENPGMYAISHYDPHPNAIAHRRIADYVLSIK